MSGTRSAALVEQFKACKVRGVLLKMAEAGQLLELKCEMPSCYCPQGRGTFVERAQPMPKWAPNPDHYPILKSAGGHLTPGNVRLAHSWCNLMDHGWRSRIKAMLHKGLSLHEIAERLNEKAIPPPHGADGWTAARVRRAYVS